MLGTLESFDLYTKKCTLVDIFICTHTFILSTEENKKSVQSQLLKIKDKQLRFNIPVWNISVGML